MKPTIARTAWTRRSGRSARSTALGLALSVSALSLSTTLAVVAAPTKVSAEEGAALALKEQGDVAMRELRYADAIKAYDAAWEKKHLPAIRYNRGRAYEAMGKLPEAIDEFDGFFAEASADIKAKVPQLAEHLAELKKKIATLILEVDVPGARVIVGAAVVGNAPIDKPLRLPAGTTIVEVSAEGYVYAKKEVTLAGGETVRMSVHLEKVSTTTTVLSVVSEPPAAITIDGQSFGTTPIEATVTAGTHTLALTKSGYATRTSTVVVAAGEHKSVRLSLEAEAGLLSKWWFWTSVGIVVAGAATVTTLAFTTRDAGRGDIAPGRISAPLVRF